MPLYEHVFLARQDISAQQVDGLLQSFRSILEERGGQVGKTEYWGLKSLAYRIKKNRKAHVYGEANCKAFSVTDNKETECTAKSMPQ